MLLLYLGREIVNGIEIHIGKLMNIRVGIARDCKVCDHHRPISTLLQGMDSVNLQTLQPERSDYERSDICPIAAASCIVENIVAYEVARALVDYYMPRLEAWLGAVGPYIDVMLFGDDLGGQNGPLMSPDMYRRYYKPWHSVLWKRAKELAPHVLTHRIIINPQTRLRGRTPQEVVMDVVDQVPVPVETL